MKAFTYIKQGVFGFTEKEKPILIDEHDAIVRVTMSSICTSDLHIKHGSVPRAVPGITVGHEMVGVVDEVGEKVTHVKPGDRVTVNVETYCGECFYCQHGYVNNCTSPHGGWALGCRIDGGQTEYVRVPYATTGLNRIPDNVSDEQALFVGDILATGFWATRISEIIFKTGGVDGCDCEEILHLISQGRIDTTPLITHRFPLSKIEEAYDIFENRKDGVIKIAIYPDAK